jgi:hypothetical protein
MAIIFVTCAKLQDGPTDNIVSGGDLFVNQELRLHQGYRI